MRKINFKKISLKAAGIFINLPWFLGRHVFFVILFFAASAAFLGAFLFYQFVFLMPEIHLAISSESFAFKEHLYEKVLERLNLSENIKEDNEDVKEDEIETKIQENMYEDPFKF